jgi:hypothetical protein
LSRDVVYFCTIAFFVAKVNDIVKIAARDDIDGFWLIRLGDIDYSKLAFETDRAALDKYRKYNLESIRANSA